MTSLSAIGDKGEPVRVSARTLDSLISDGTIAGCDVLKIDIEGAEPLALRGMESFLQNIRLALSLLRFQNLCWPISM